MARRAVGTETPFSRSEPNVTTSDAREHVLGLVDDVVVIMHQGESVTEVLAEESVLSLGLLRVAGRRIGTGDGLGVGHGLRRLDADDLCRRLCFAGLGRLLGLHRHHRRRTEVEYRGRRVDLHELELVETLLLLPVDPGLLEQAGQQWCRQFLHGRTIGGVNHGK